mgnify:CR=1 FL=1|jgi:hypothetical protein
MKKCSLFEIFKLEADSLGLRLSNAIKTIVSYKDTEYELQLSDLMKGLSFFSDDYEEVIVSDIKMYFVSHVIYMTKLNGVWIAKSIPRNPPILAKKYSRQFKLFAIKQGAK